jgi:DHA1 family multidrug resistance protein-like MFS transporter
VDLTRPFTKERFEVEQTLAAEKIKSLNLNLQPTKISDGTIVVDWNSTNDQDNPQNWGYRKKGIVVAQMAAYSLAVYCASSLYVLGEEGMMEEFQVGYTPAAVGLAIYVLGYGFGPVSTYDVDEISGTSAD